MNIKYNDKRYINIIKDILKNEEFDQTKYIEHHGITRYDHSVRVSYYSYLICKFLHLNYKETARAALLHDFFLDTNNNVDAKTRFYNLIKHPSYALINAESYYELSDLEEDIICKHMFPITAVPPKYLESWIVDIVDDISAVYEKYHITRKQLVTASNFLLLIIFNYIK